MTDTPYDAAMTRNKQELARQLVDANARIEALEAALRKIADAPAWGAPDRWETTPAEVRWLARAALAPEPEK